MITFDMWLFSSRRCDWTYFSFSAPKVQVCEFPGVQELWQLQMVGLTP